MSLPPVAIDYLEQEYGGLYELKRELVFPKDWNEIVSSESVSALLATLNGLELPRFVDYISRRVDGVAVGSLSDMPCLFVSLPDWHFRRGVLYPGVMILGAPAPLDALESIEKRVGKLPPALRGFWRRFSFCSLKNGGFLCTVGATVGRTLVETVEPIAGKFSLQDEPDKIYECLKIAVVSDQVVSVLTRSTGETAWNDHVMQHFRRELELATSPNKTIDSLLADWEFEVWAPS
jgi:hypothetical protein